MADAILDGAGNVLRPSTREGLVELRTLLGVAQRLGRDDGWSLLAAAIRKDPGPLLAALPTAHDPSDLEERAYADGRTAVIDEIQSWIGEPRADGRSPEDELRSLGLKLRALRG